jgi:hypothetical protein
MSDAFLETTKWDGTVPNHTYLLDGDKAIAYIKAGSKDQFFFTKPIQIDKRGRTFVKVTPNPFTLAKEEKDPSVVEVAGSKGAVYYVNTQEKTCTCPGFTFRGTCKHLTT